MKVSVIVPVYNTEQYLARCLDSLVNQTLQEIEILVVDDMQLACRMAEPLGVAVAYAGWSGMGVAEVEREMKEQCAFSFTRTDELEAFLFEED